MTCCISLLSVDAFANKAAFVGKVIKGVEKSAKGSKYWYKGTERGADYFNYGVSRAGMVAGELEKNNRLNRTRDSLYWDSPSMHLQMRSQKLYRYMDDDYYEYEDRYAGQDISRLEWLRKRPQLLNSSLDDSAKIFIPYKDSIIEDVFDNESFSEYKIDFLPKF